jgi:hypothetical protein
MGSSNDSLPAAAFRSKRLDRAQHRLALILKTLAQIKGRTIQLAPLERSRLHLADEPLTKSA